MVKKLICFIFAVCILYTVPAHAASKAQFEIMIKQYIQNEVAEAVHRECIYYNAQPPQKIYPLIPKFDNEECGIVLDFLGGCDPRVVSVAADMIALETYNILKRLGMSDRQMQQADYYITVLPVTKNKNGNVIAYDGSVIYWKGTNKKLISISAEKLQGAANKLNH